MSVSKQALIVLVQVASKLQVPPGGDENKRTYLAVSSAIEEAVKEIQRLEVEEAKGVNGIVPEKVEGKVEDANITR